MPYTCDEHETWLVYATILNIFFEKIIHKWVYSQNHVFFPTELEVLGKSLAQSVKWVRKDKK